MSELERKNGPSAVAETVTKDGRRIGTEVLFSAKDITKTFGGTQALKGVELEIHPGEIVGLVGENGAGKSTLLKIIIGAQPQTSGTMSFHGAPYEPKTPMDANKAEILRRTGAECPTPAYWVQPPTPVQVPCNPCNACC